jgi:hypothetical protein
MTPHFPIRIIFDDGEVQEIADAEELMETIDTIDSTDPGNRIWVRDALDSTVRLRMRGGTVEVFEVQLTRASVPAQIPSRPSKI